MIEIRMPRLSESMTGGKLLLWNVAVGDFVQQGDQLAEVEADKANMEIEAPMSGVICNLIGRPGDMVEVDSILVELKEELSHELADAPVDTPPDASVAQPRETTDPTPNLDSPLERRLKNFSNPESDAT